MQLRRGDVVWIEARVVEDDGERALVQFAGNFAEHRVRLDKSEIRAHRRDGVAVSKDGA